MKPTFFETPEDLRAWLQRNHDSAAELLVGLYKKGTGKPSITWPELVDQLLCFGWIDGVRRSLGADAYTIRITPRRRGSNWSMVNLRRARELIDAGLVEAPGLAAWEARDEEKARKYSYERESAELDEALEAEIRANPKAWAFYDSQPPGYRKQVALWIMSAKREETRRKRLETLIRDSENGLRIGPLRRQRREP